MILLESEVDNDGNIYATIREHSSIAMNSTARVHDIPWFPQGGTYQKVMFRGEKYAMHQGGTFAQLNKIGAARGQLDDEDLRIHNVDVKVAYRRRGFSLALMQALIVEGLKNGVSMRGTAYLIADERKSEGLRNYYGRMGFKADSEYGETEYPQQYAMQAEVNVAISKIMHWRGRYRLNEPVNFVFSS
jgi:hypothetical protein